MAVMVRKFQCAQIPDLKIIGIDCETIKYFVHAAQVVGILTGKDTRWAASNALNNFLRSQEGSSIQKGGDLLTAYSSGPMNKMIYTHHLHSGPYPSYFLTIEGVEEVLRYLPNQVESMKQKFRALFDAYRTNSSSAFNLDTRDDGHAVDEIEEIERDMQLVPHSMLHDVRFQSFKMQVSAELTLEKERVSMEKDRSHLMMRAMQAEQEKIESALKFEKERTAMEKERTAMEKERAALTVKAKDFEIEKMKMQLETANNRSKLQPENVNKKRTATDDSVVISGEVYDFTFLPVVFTDMKFHRTPSPAGSLHTKQSAR